MTNFFCSFSLFFFFSNKYEHSLLILQKSKNKLWFLYCFPCGSDCCSFRDKVLGRISSSCIALCSLLLSCDTVCLWVFQEERSCFGLEIGAAGFGNLAGLEVGMSFTSAQSQCKGSVDCLFSMQGVMCSVMLLWLHLKLEAAVLVFERLPPIKAPRSKWRCTACEEQAELLWPGAGVLSESCKETGRERGGLLTTPCARDNWELSKMY